MFKNESIMLESHQKSTLSSQEAEWRWTASFLFNDERIIFVIIYAIRFIEQTSNWIAIELRMTKEAHIPIEFFQN